MKKCLVKIMLITLAIVMLLMSIYPITAYASRVVIPEGESPEVTEYRKLGDEIKVQMVVLILIFFIGTIFWLFYFWVVSGNKKYNSEEKNLKMNITKISLIITIAALLFNIISYASLQGDGFGDLISDGEINYFYILRIIDILIIVYILYRNIKVSRKISGSKKDLGVNKIDGENLDNKGE